VADVPRETPKRIFIALNKRDPSAFDAYWLDLDTGKLELAAQKPWPLLGVPGGPSATGAGGPGAG